MKKLTVVLTLILMSLGTVFAQSHIRDRRDLNRNVERMQYDARVKIADGIIDGTITAREANRLLISLERIQEKQMRMSRNGRLTRNERERLRRDIMNLNRMITREIRDGERMSRSFARNGRRY